MITISIVGFIAVLLIYCLYELWTIRKLNKQILINKSVISLLRTRIRILESKLLKLENLKKRLNVLLELKQKEKDEKENK